MRAWFAALAALLVVATPAQAGRGQVSVIEDSSALLRSGDAVREQTLDDMAFLGADVVRILVLWRDVAAAPGLTLGALDAAVAGAQARGLEVLLTPTGPGPPSASRCARPPSTRGACRPSPARFAAFVRTLGARYPAVRRWAVWNEPNVPRWLTPQYDARGRPASPAHYRRLVRAAASALRATGHGADQLLVGETAPVGGVRGRSPDRPMAPGVFVRSLLCEGARRCARLPGTGWAHHPYTRGGSRPPRTAAARDELTIMTVGHLERWLSRAARRGATARRLDVWFTESGWQTAPPDRLFGVAPARQAAFLNELDWLAYRRPRVRSVAQYLVRDEAPSGGFQSGLRWLDGRPKPAFKAYRTAIHVAGRTVYGQVRPAGRGAAVALEHRRPGGRWRVAVRTRTRDARGHVLVRLRSARAGHWRLAWEDAAGRTVRSRATSAAPAR